MNWKICSRAPPTWFIWLRKAQTAIRWSRRWKHFTPNPIRISPAVLERRCLTRRAGLLIAMVQRIRVLKRLRANYRDHWRIVFAVRNVSFFYYRNRFRSTGIIITTIILHLSEWPPSHGHGPNFWRRLSKLQLLICSLSANKKVVILSVKFATLTTKASAESFIRWLKRPPQTKNLTNFTEKCQKFGQFLLFVSKFSAGLTLLWAQGQSNLCPCLCK